MKIIPVIASLVLLSWCVYSVTALYQLQVELNYTKAHLESCTDSAKKWEAAAQQWETVAGLWEYTATRWEKFAQSIRMDRLSRGIRDYESNQSRKD